MLGCHPVKMLGENIYVEELWGVLTDKGCVTDIRQRLSQCVQRTADRFEVGNRKIVEEIS